MWQEITEATTPHEVEGIDRLHVIVLDHARGPLVAADPYAVVVLVADRGELAFLFVQCEQAQGRNHNRRYGDGAADVGGDVGFHVADAQGAEIVGRHAHAGAKQLAVVDIELLVVGIVVTVLRLATGNLEGYRAVGQRHGVDRVNAFVVGHLNLAVNLIGQAQPRVAVADVKALGVHVHRATQATGTEHQLIIGLPRQVSPLEIGFPFILLRLDRGLNGHTDGVGHTVAQLRT